MTEASTETPRDVAGVIAAADAGFRRWSTLSAAERASRLGAVAALYEERREELSRAMTADTGKLISEGRAEVDSCVQIYRYYSEHWAELLRAEIVDESVGRIAKVELRPTGVVMGVLPWNYPQYQLARLAAPNLLLGNSLLLKHARICSRSMRLAAALHAEALGDAGVLIDSGFGHAEVREAIADDRVRGVSFTGGERAGAEIARTAGANLTKSVLELGGSDPFIVFHEEKVEELARTVARLRLSNAGQTCVSPKRVIVRADLKGKFLEAFARVFLAARPGDPYSDTTLLGPLATVAAAQELRDHVRLALSEGAVVIGEFDEKAAPSREFLPLIIDEPSTEHAVWRTELFGPIAIIKSAETLDDAIELANDSPYGLGATVFTDRADDLERFQEEIEAGMLSVNTVKGGNPAYPFGGVKLSGYGRELGALGIREFANQRLVVLGAPPDAAGASSAVGSAAATRQLS